MVSLLVSAEVSWRLGVEKKYHTLSHSCEFIQLCSLLVILTMLFVEKLKCLRLSAKIRVAIGLVNWKFTSR